MFQSNPMISSTCNYNGACLESEVRSGKPVNAEGTGQSKIQLTPKIDAVSH